MKGFKQKIAYLLFAVIFAFSGSVWAQNYNANSYNNRSPKLSGEELRNLVAPIALYPDPLLAQILPASTYPLEIVDAARMIHSEKDFSKIDPQNWDPSVKAVAHYPEVLKMMNDRLDWTQALGQAVLNQQEDVLKAVQDLRRQAQNVGSLKSTPQQKVRQPGDFIEIIPADPELVYVPYYDPVAIYTVPTVELFAPPISFGFGFSIGSGWFTGFYWPSYSIVYADPYYWGPYYWGPRYWWSWGTHPRRILNISAFKITNFNRNYFTINQKNFDRVRWSHDERHGNPFNGRASTIQGPLKGNLFNAKALPPSFSPKGNLSTLDKMERQKGNPALENRMGADLKNREMKLAPMSHQGMIEQGKGPDLKGPGIERARPMNAKGPSTIESRQGMGHPMLQSSPHQSFSPRSMGGPRQEGSFRNPGGGGGGGKAHH